MSPADIHVSTSNWSNDGGDVMPIGLCGDNRHGSDVNESNNKSDVIPIAL
jgi:hypothetical protein